MTNETALVQEYTVHHGATRKHFERALYPADAADFDPIVQGDDSDVEIGTLRRRHLFTGDNLTSTGGLDETGNIPSSNSLPADLDNCTISAVNGLNGDTFGSGVIAQDSTAAPNAFWPPETVKGVVAHRQIFDTMGAVVNLGDFYEPSMTEIERSNGSTVDSFPDQVDAQGLNNATAFILGRRQSPITNDIVKMSFINGIGHAGAQAIGVVVHDNVSGVTVTQYIKRTTDPGPGRSKRLPDSAPSLTDPPNGPRQGSFSRLHLADITRNIGATGTTEHHILASINSTDDLGNVSLIANDFWSYIDATLDVTGPALSFVSPRVPHSALLPIVRSVQFLKRLRRPSMTSGEPPPSFVRSFRLSVRWPRSGAVM